MYFIGLLIVSDSSHHEQSAYSLVLYLDRLVEYKETKQTD